MSAIENGIGHSAEIVAKQQAERELFQNINITLVGSPGTGKTSVGRILAEMTGMEYVDTDELVERRVNMPVGDYIDLNGREAFYGVQDAELKATLLSRKGMVIGTGGAIVERNRPDNLGVMQMESIMVYLKTGLETLIERNLKDDTHRPGLTRLVEGDNGEKTVEHLSPDEVRTELLRRYGLRHEAWETAPIKIRTDKMTPRGIAALIKQNVAKHVESRKQNRVSFEGGNA